MWASEYFCLVWEMSLDYNLRDNVDHLSAVYADALASRATRLAWLLQRPRYVRLRRLASDQRCQVAAQTEFGR